MKILQRLKVIATSFVTYASLAAFVLTVVAEELPGAASYIVPVVAYIGSIVTIIRRVTPVLPDERGILPALPSDDV